MDPTSSQSPSAVAARPVSRRTVLRWAAATGAAAALGLRLPRAHAMGGHRYDDGSDEVPAGVAGTVDRVIVVGAGWAGLAAANALRTAGIDAVVLEGGTRIGGRARTADVGGSSIDLGCSWIHEPVGNPLTRLAAQAGVVTTPGDVELDAATFRFHDERTGDVPLHQAGAVYQHYFWFDEAVGDLSQRLGPDASLRDGIRLYLDDEGLTGDQRRRVEYLLRVITEQPESLEWERVSLAAYAGFEEPYIGVGQGNLPVGGYGRLIDAIAGDLDVRLDHVVESISWDDAGVTVQARGRGGVVTERASHVIVTSSLGVLQAGSIGFEPGLPAAKLDAIGRMGFGAFEKIAMRFDEPFWEDGAKTHIFYASDEPPMQTPMFLDMHRLAAEPVLVALSTAQAARQQIGRGPSAALTAVMGRLDTVMGGTVPRPTHVEHTSWLSDPLVLGSYSSSALGEPAKAREILAAPVAGRVLFAGEATSATRWGYADGAFSTGVREAKRLLGTPEVELSVTPQL